MINKIRKDWNKNMNHLKEAIANLPNIDDLEYTDLVKLAFSTIYEEDDDLNLNNITVIDDGDYQGTLLFLIPFNTYQPSESEYLMTFIDYGSCTVCDILQGIQDHRNDREQQNADLLTLCRNILQNTIRPYNKGWRYSEDFDEYDEVKMEVEE